MEIKERSQIEEQYKWDITTLFANDEAWEEALSVIDIDADERTRRIFYSNLYHSLIKPSDWTGESFLYDDPEGKLPFTLDYMTFWDIYKTELPLLFWLFHPTVFHARKSQGF